MCLIIMELFIFKTQKREDREFSQKYVEEGEQAMSHKSKSSMSSLTFLSIHEFTNNFILSLYVQVNFAVYISFYTGFMVSQ